MRKINLKVLFGLMVGVTVCAALVFVIHHFQSQRIADALLWQARRAEEVGQVERVVRYLSRYLEFRPDDLEEKARLGRVLVSGEYAGSVRARSRGLDLLETVLRVEPGRQEDRTLLVKASLELGRLKVARDSLEVLWKDIEDSRAQVPPAELGVLEGYWGMLLEAEGNAGDAMAWCRKAIGHAPQERDNYLRLAYLLRYQAHDDPAQRRAGHAEADKVIDALVATNKESPEAHLARWRYRREFNLLDLSPNEPDSTRVPLETAAEDVRTALKQLPESVEVLLAAADMERLRNQRHVARAYLERGLEIHAREGAGRKRQDATQIQLLWQLTNLVLDDALSARDEPQKAQAELGRAAQRIAQIRKLRGTASAADYLEGRLRLQQQQWGEAVALLERARSLMQNKPELERQIDLYLGQGYERLEEPSQMYEAYQRVAASDPSSSAALLGMAGALWSQGRLDEAMANYQKVMARDRIPENGWLEIARLEVLRQLQREKKQRAWALAEKALQRAAEMKPRSIPITLLRAEILVAQDQLDAAEQLLEKARGEKPEEEVELWVALAELALRRKDHDRAVRILDDGEKELGSQVAFRLARARLALREKAPGTDGVLSQVEQGMSDLEHEDRARLLEGLAQAYFRAGKIKEARRLCQRLAQHPRHRADLKLHLFLFDLALRDNDEAAMEEILGTIHELEQGRGAYYRYGQAIRLIWAVRHKQTSPDDREELLTEARQHLELVSRQRPTWPPIHLAMAEIHEIEGSPEQAILELKQAIQKGENSPAVVQRLVRALVQRGRDNEADEELKKLRQSLLAHSELGRLAAHVALRQGDTARALQLARDAVAVESASVRDQVWMARILAASNVPSEAEQKLRQAIEQAGPEPEPWVALVQLLADRKRTDEALRVIAQARTRVDPKRLPLTLAQCYEALGQAKEAVKHYEEAEKQHASDVAVLRSAIRFYLRVGRVPRAEVLLRRIVEGKVEAGDADRTWAQRGLALVLANGTDYRRFREALGLVGLRMDDSGRLDLDTLQGKAPTELHRTRARILATQSPRSYREAAIVLFELLDRMQALSADDRLVLAMLHERTGSWARARDQYLTLVLPETDSPRPLAQLILGMLREGEYEGVERWLTQLESLEKKKGVEAGAFGSLELRAQLLEKRGQPEQAVEVLKRYISRPGAPAEEQLVLASLYGRIGRMDDALGVCREARKSCPPEQVGGVSLALFRISPPGEAQGDELERWLRQQVDEQPRNMALRMQLADLYDLRGRYREAEAEYRIVLAPENEPTNAVALNNLAWLLALQSGREQEALQLVTNAINGYGRRPELLDTRGTIYLTLGRTEDALADLKDAVRDVANPVRLFHLARAYHQVRDRESAIRSLRQAQEMGLQPERMHPVEQQACKRLLADLKL